MTAGLTGGRAGRVPPCLGEIDRNLELAVFVELEVHDALGAHPVNGHGGAERFSSLMGGPLVVERWSHHRGVVAVADGPRLGRELVRGQGVGAAQDASGAVARTRPRRVCSQCFIVVGCWVLRDHLPSSILFRSVSYRDCGWAAGAIVGDSARRRRGGWSTRGRLATAREPPRPMASRRRRDGRSGRRGCSRRVAAADQVPSPRTNLTPW